MLKRTPWTNLGMMIVLFLLMPIVCWADSYLCVEQRVTGFSFDMQSRNLVSSEFTANSKFIVAWSGNSLRLEVKRIGLAMPFADCEDKWTGVIRCHGPLGDFRMNVRTLRFISTHVIGYLSGDPNQDTVSEGGASLSLGECSPF